MTTRMTTRKRSLIAALLLGGVILGGYGLWIQASPRRISEINPTGTNSTSTQDASVTSSDSGSSAESADWQEFLQTPRSPEELTTEQIQQVVEGNWTSEFYGTRYLTIRDDGTATILFQANTLASMFVGQRLRIEYEWRYDPQSKQVIFNTTGGVPQKSLDYVAKMWGSQQRQNVLTVSSQELHLLDLDGKTEHRWKQMPAIPEDVKKRFEKL